MQFKLKVTELTEEEVFTIMDSAMMGCAYWCEKITIRYKNEDTKKECKNIDIFSEKSAKALKNGCDVRFYDIYENTIFYLTYPKLLKGVEKWINGGYCSSINEIFTGNEDIEDADMIIQYALFDKIIYG